MASDQSPTSLKGVLTGHPQGLYVLFFAEMWERFSYYGMRALLILFMTKQLLYTDQFSTEIYGAYTALVYATPVFGGMLADRLLGFRKAVILGGVLMALGHFAMAFVDLAGNGGAEVSDKYTLYLALALLIVGNGFFKPNISSLVGKLYKEGDAKRDVGFTIFYMGINLGAFLSPIICGYVGETIGWHWGFGLAGIGMVLGLVNFILGQHRFAGHADPPDMEYLKKPVFAGINREWVTYIGAIVAVGVAWVLVGRFGIIGGLLNGFGVIVVASILYYCIKRCDRVERDRLFVALLITSFSVVFWAFFEQAGSSINLFTDRNVDRNLFGMEIPASVYQAANAFFIVTLGPLFSWLWIRLDTSNRQPSIPLKFGLGIIQLGLGFGALYMGAVTSQESGMVAMSWLILGYLLHTTGELCLSPVGLSAITKLSPTKIVGLMMGVWFLATAYAQYVGAVIAKTMSINTEGGDASEVPPTESVMVYGEVFGKIALVAIGIGLAIAIFSPLIRRLCHGVK